MAVVYLFAHFDDEYCAWPMIRAWAKQGLDQHFLYLADYAPQDAERRFAETRTFLARFGLDPRRARHVGRGTGVLDGEIFRDLPAARAAVRDALAAIGPVERIVTPAWEGGHMDHDMCALLATVLAPELGDPSIYQFSLYNGRGLTGRLFHGGRPLPENGPVERIGMSARDWVRYLAGVRFFPSQVRTWIGLWPMMFAGLALRGFGCQRLAPDRILERPHLGPLLYERMYGVSYETVRAAADQALARAKPAPA